MSAAAFPKTAVPWQTWRLIPSRFPPIGAFDTVATPADLQAVMDLEGWTNDRLVATRLGRLPEHEWCVGIVNASIVMAAFLHAPISGARFNGPDLGAWYAADQENTAIAEVSHHMRRELNATALPFVTRTFRAYVSRLEGDSYVDIRGKRPAHPALYDVSDYSASQGFGESVRTSGEHGIVFDSLRFAGGTNVVAYRPNLIHSVAQAFHFDIHVPIAGPVTVKRL